MPLNLPPQLIVATSLWQNARQKAVLLIPWREEGLGVPVAQALALVFTCLNSFKPQSLSMLKHFKRKIK